MSQKVVERFSDLQLGPVLWSPVMIFVYQRQAFLNIFIS